ncbi:MAG: plasmid stabilization protein [Alphaproteobacteria bacterium]|nr:plasmid stabilization protein [Alphaproteobacteria bacterium]
MAALTIRNISDDLKQRLRMSAAEHGRSMEEEARQILGAALQPRDRADEPGRNLAEMVRRHFAPLGGVELELPPREPMREPLKFDE